MVGQKKLLAQFNNFTIDTLPGSMLLIGPSGCGKHMLTEDLSKRLHLTLEELKSDVTPEYLISLQQKTLKTLYLINLSDIIEKDQNKFLKFIEEPTASVNIILIAESKSGILETILNRCKIYQFEDYSIDELKSIYSFDNEYVYKICKTPGQLKLANEKQIEQLVNLCRSIARNTKASYANFMKIALKINYKDFFDKFDFNMFFNALSCLAFEEYLQNNTEASYEIYLFTTNYYQKTKLVRSFAREPFMLNFLTLLWETGQKCN